MYKRSLILGYKNYIRDENFILALLMFFIFSAMSFLNIRTQVPVINIKQFLSIASFFILFSLFNDFFYFSKFKVLEKNMVKVYKLSRLQIYLIQIIFNSFPFLNFLYLIFLSFYLSFFSIKIALIFLVAGVLFTFVYKIMFSSIIMYLSKNKNLLQLIMICLFIILYFFIKIDK